MPCNAIAVTTGQLTFNTKLLLHPPYYDAVKNTLSSVAGQNLTAMRSSRGLDLYGSNFTIRISTTGVVQIQVRQSGLNATQAQTLNDKLAKAVTALAGMLAQAATAAIIANSFAIERANADAQGNITLALNI